MERILLSLFLLCSCALRTARIEERQREVAQLNKLSLDALLQREGLTMRYSPLEHGQGYATDKDGKGYLLVAAQPTITKTFHRLGCPPAGRGTPSYQIPYDLAALLPTNSTLDAPSSQPTLTFVLREVLVTYSSLRTCYMAP